jgi:hypothetical protein
MRRFLAACFAVASISAFEIVSHAAPITYNIGPFTAVGAGLDPWILTGTIVTDGKLGTIAPSDIVSWEWSVWSDGSELNHSTSANGVPTVGVGGLVGLSSALEMLYPPDLGYAAYLELKNSGEGPSQSGTSDLQMGTYAPGVLGYSTFGANINAGWDYQTSEPDPARDQLWFPITSPTLPSGLFVVATAVPEPTTITLLAAALVMLAAVRIMRRRHR